MCFVQSSEILTLSFHLIPCEGTARNLCLKSGHWYKSSLDEIGELILYSEKQALLFGGIRAPACKGELGCSPPNIFHERDCGCRQRGRGSSSRSSKNLQEKSRQVLAVLAVERRIKK